MDDTKHWLYKLRLTDPGKLGGGFTEDEQATMGRHGRYLRQLTDAGTCILAGRTDAGDRTFGIVILRAQEEAAARQLMEGDPAVADGLMQAELFPFMLALLAQKDAAKS